jgi:nitronate monooxygenase
MTTHSWPALAVPIVAAPMAGGPSTPQLVHAAAGAGGLGFLAAGYKTVTQLEAQIAETRTLGTERFGVNLFVPEPHTPPMDAVLTYRGHLAPIYTRLGISTPTPHDDDDAFAAKVQLVLEHRVPVVSFTFGLPQQEIVEQLHRNGTAVAVTVTTPDEARAALALGIDALVVQGPEAGGHRATFHVADQPTNTPLTELLGTVLALPELERDGAVIAAGGIHSAHQVRELLRLGAAAVQVGTALLRAPEAGTKPVHADALVSQQYAQTVVTRAFSGRPARGLRNAFIDEFDAAAPAAYPEVNQLTAPIRAAALDDASVQAMWAGTGHAWAQARPAAEIIAELAGGR